MNELNWKPNRNLSIPLHEQIYHFFKEKIMQGEWTVGTKLPSQRRLAAALEVNRSTIANAFEELIADGFIQSEVGRGTIVINNSWSLLSSTPPPDWNSYVKAGSHQPNHAIIQDINKAEADLSCIRLGTGELSPELLPNEQMQIIFQQQKNYHLGYPEPKGSLSLREAIAKHVSKKGIQTSASSILIVSGGLQALQLISIGLLHRGSTILTENPSYLHSVQVFQSAGMQLANVPMDDQGIQIEALRKIKKHQNGALLYTIPSFHNPTGIIMSESRREQLMKLCQQEQLPIIEDDVYHDLWLGSSPPLSLKSRDQYGLVLHIGSVSKTLSPGLRIGWIIGPEPVINRLADIKMQSDYGSSSLSQHAVTEWLSTERYEQHLNHIRKELKLRRDFMLQLLESHFSAIASWNIPAGGFYIWLTILPRISMRTLFNEALKVGILLNPGNIYGETNEQKLRLSYSYASLPDIEKGLLKIAEIIHSYNKL